MSLNSFLLSKFANHKLPTSGRGNYLAVHYQVLAILYLNFVLSFLVVLYEVGSWVLLNVAGGNSLPIFICIIGTACSVSMVKMGHYDAAGVIILLYVHIVNSMTTHLMNIPMAGIFGTFCYINLTPLLIKSDWIIILNSLVSIGELILHVKKLLEIFQVTLTDDQFIQVYNGSVSIFVAYGYLSGLALIQKMIQASLWNMVHTNFQKSEELTKEVVEAIGAKDNFVSTLSHEVKNILSPLNESIEHLMKVLHNSNYTQLLKNAKTSAEILLNLVESAIDAVRIKAHKLELAFEEADFEDVIRKTLIIASQSLQKKKIYAQAFIDRAIPEKVWTDSGRIIQVMMNLVSNAIKFTPNEGKIKIDVIWYDESQRPANILAKVEDENLANLSMNSINSINNSMQNLISPSTSRSLLNPSRLCSSFDWRRNNTNTNQNNEDNIVEFDEEEYSIRQRNLIALKRPAPHHLRRSARSAINYAESWSLKQVNYPHHEEEIDENKPRKSQKGYIKVQITDTGCGISDDKILDIFERFDNYVPHASNPNSHQGIGLWLCREICHKMNGEITCYSRVRRGTTFVFYILVDSPEVKIPIGSQMNLRQPRETVNALVVDDYDFNRNLHKLLLEREGVQVTIAADGKEALEKYKSMGNNYFDLILMDINMPVMNGITSAKMIREFELESEFKPASIYFVSGDYFSQDQVMNEFKSIIPQESLGRIRFMKKPVDIKLLSRIVEDHSRFLLAQEEK